MYGAPKCSGINVVVHQVKDLPLFYPYGRPVGNTGNIKNLQGHDFIVVFHYSKDLIFFNQDIIIKKTDSICREINLECHIKFSS